MHGRQLDSLQRPTELSHEKETSIHQRQSTPSHSVIHREMHVTAIKHIERKYTVLMVVVHYNISS